MILDGSVGLALCTIGVYNLLMVKKVLDVVWWCMTTKDICSIDILLSCL